MKFEYKARGFRAVLYTGNRSNIKIHITNGRAATNPIADKIDTYGCFDVMGTVFQESCSSIFFKEKRQRTWGYIRGLVRRSIEDILGRPVTVREVSVKPSLISE